MPATKMTLAELLAELTKLGGYHLTACRPWETSLGRHGVARGVNATYMRLVDGTVRAVCTVRLVTSRFSYGLDRVVACDEVTAEFSSTYGVAIVSKETTYTPYKGVDFGVVA